MKRLFGRTNQMPVQEQEDISRAARDPIIQGSSTVEPLKRETIEDILREAGLFFLRDTVGDILVRFVHQEEWGCSLDCWLLVDETCDVYTVRVRSDRQLQREEWDKAIWMCNTWNQANRWPNAFVHIPRSDWAVICLEENLGLHAGVHRELLADFTMTAIWAADMFWRWAAPQLVHDPESSDPGAPSKTPARA